MRANQLNRILDKLDREVTMRVWQETIKVVDVLNEETPLERRELPVVFVKTMHYEQPTTPEYPPREIPSVIEKGTLMWWSIDDVFEKVINPGYAFFATAENVQAHGNMSVSFDPLNDSDDNFDKSYNDPALKELLEASVLTSSSSVTKSSILDYLNNELNIFVPSENSITLPQTLSSPGEYLVPLKINNDGCTDNIRVQIVL